jgi:hypothetical protein
MSLKTEAIKRFLTAARSLANQGLSREAIMQFAKNEFGEITELFQRQIDNIFRRPASGIEKIKIKDPDFDDTVIKMQFDEEGIPFNPKDPLKYYGAPKKSITEQMDDIKDTSKKLDEAIKEYENIYKPKQNRPDVYGIRDYDTTNMSEIKQQIIKTENKLGNLDPDSPDFKEKAKVLIDEIEDLKGKLKDEKPRTDKYTGGIVDVEPSLSDIGHGSDALMARTRLMSPGQQATTSTGLNYLLAEDNDNLRVPFSDGGQERKRFFKAGLAAGDDISPGTTTSGQFRGGGNGGGGGGNNNPPPPASVATEVKPVSVIEEELEEPVKYSNRGKLMTKRDLINKKNFIDFVDRFGYDSGAGNVYADNLYDQYTKAIGAMPNEAIVNSVSDQITKEVDGNTLQDLLTTNTSFTFPNNTSMNRRVSTIQNMGDTTTTELTPQGIYEDGKFVGISAPATLGLQTQGNTILNLARALNDNQNFNQGGRARFSKGKLADAARRKFMKAAGAGAAGLAALKTGLINLAKDAGPKVEAVKESVGGVPDYFFRLVDKIRFMGDETLASQDKAIAKKYKDYVMEEDFAGNITIVKSGEDLQGNKLEDVYMSYKVDDVATKDKKGFARAEEYEEFTARPDAEGKMKDVEPGVPDEVIEEAGDVEAMTLKKANGGRIGYSKGKLALKAGEKIKTLGSRTLAFLEKIFGKEAMAEMPKRDPDLYKGLLEVTEAYRARDKEGLKMYMQKFLPHMNDAEIEEFIVGNPEIGDMSGVLLRLGSGRDYKAKIDMIKEANEKRKLADLDVTEDMKRKPNASGGIAKLLGE